MKIEIRFYNFKIKNIIFKNENRTFRNVVLKNENNIKNKKRKN